MIGRKKQKPLHLALIGLSLLAVAAVFWLPARPGWTAFDPPGNPTPTPDPLATPVLPENPTEIELGSYSYYHNCMPCHGDKGQGLTDAWRQVWVEDHQNCWARGCHGGGSDDGGFPLPKSIPAVMHTADNLSRFTTVEELLVYLRTTHPPQRPGALPDEEYHALTTLLLIENGRQLQREEPQPTTGIVVAAILTAMVLLTIAILARLHHESGNCHVGSRNLP
jgi:hypothetical protein